MHPEREEDVVIQIVIGGGRTVAIEEVSMAFSELGLPEFVTALRMIIERYGSEQLKLLIDGLEIQATPSVFTTENRDQVATLEKVASGYPFSRWLKGQGISSTLATRKHLCQWWEAFMLMAGEHGYVPAGHINQVSRTMNLWKATGPLASKMQANPDRYKFLPALLVNHPQEVARVLGVIDEAEPFIEILIGQRMEDLRMSEACLGAFSIVEDENGQITRTTAAALFSVLMILQRG